MNVTPCTATDRRSGSGIGNPIPPRERGDSLTLSVCGTHICYARLGQHRLPLPLTTRESFRMRCGPAIGTGPERPVLVDANPRGLPTLRNLVAIVVEGRPEEQMGGVHARGVIASMAHLHSMRHLNGVGPLPREPMGLDRPPRQDGERAISDSVLDCRPPPAVIGAAAVVGVLPEAIQNVYGFGHTERKYSTPGMRSTAWIDQ